AIAAIVAAAAINRDRRRMRPVPQQRAPRGTRRPLHQHIAGNIVLLDRQAIELATLFGVIEAMREINAAVHGGILVRLMDRWKATQTAAANNTPIGAA